MAVTTDNIKYASSTTMICTLAALSNGTVRGSTAVDNTTNLYDDAMLQIAIKTTSTAVAADKACYIYLYGSEDGTNFNVGSNEWTTPGTDGAITIDSPTNMKGPIAMAAILSSSTYRMTIGSVAAFFGGILPRLWGFAFANSTNVVLDITETNHKKSYTGITYTNQ